MVLGGELEKRRERKTHLKQYSGMPDGSLSANLQSVLTSARPAALTSCGTPSSPQWSLDGQLGNGAVTDDNVPLPVTVSGNRTFTVIAAGTYHTCAIAETGSMWCWGESPHNGQSNDSNVPAEVVGGHTFMSASAGSSTCGLDNSGDVWCFGGYAGFIMAVVRTRHGRLIGLGADALLACITGTRLPASALPQTYAVFICRD